MSIGKTNKCLQRGFFKKSEYGPWQGGTDHTARPKKYGVVANARASIPHTFFKSVAFHLLQDI